MRVQCRNVYQFAELSDTAKEKAREWFRRDYPDDDWWDCVYEDATTIAELMGIDLKTRVAKLMGGGTRMEPQIYFSGFASQGDGACFVGSYRYAKGSVKAVKQHAPLDTELHRIVEGLYECQRRAFYGITAYSTHRGHYNHSGCMDIDCDCEHEFDAHEVRQLLRHFADWIYGQLEQQYWWLVADEQVDESIVINEYEFLEDGSRA